MHPHRCGVLACRFLMCHAVPAHLDHGRQAMALLTARFPIPRLVDLPELGPHVRVAVLAANGAAADIA